jgi:hypothetical protein
MMEVQNGATQAAAADGRAPPQKKPKTKYPKIFQCTGYGDCKMTFTRSEHLARHIRKHTGERPFRCHCNRTFSRLDNLRQHIQTVHANEHHILRAPPPPPLGHSNKGVDDMVPTPPGAGGPFDGHPVVGKHRPKPIDLSNTHDGDHMAVDSPPESPGTATLPPYQHNKMGAYSPTSPYHHPVPGPYGPNGSAPPLHNGGSAAAIQNGWYSEQPLPPPPPPPPTSYQYPPYASDPTLRSYRSMAGLSTSSTASISSNGGGGGAGLRASIGSNMSSPAYPSSNTSRGSWLSNVLCEPNDDSDRPHTWGPSYNRYSTATDDADTASIASGRSGRSGLSNLVSVTESAHISSPPPGQLPSLSSLVNGAPADSPTNRPQLSQNRSYTKNLILPRPDSFPPPKGYVLPMADTRPPALPPAGQVVPISKNKPLPPLPAEAHQESRDGQPAGPGGGGMDMLIQAAGV